MTKMRHRLFKKSVKVKRTKRQILVMNLKLLVAMVFLIINIALIIHFFFELTMPETNSLIAHFFDLATRVFIEPFQNMSPSFNLGNGSVIDLAILMAFVFFTLFAWVLISLINATFPETVAKNYEADIESYS